MMRKEENFLNDTAPEVSCNSQKNEKYEKPVLSVVKFMFENDITFGSFDHSHAGENELSVESNWWD